MIRAKEGHARFITGVGAERGRGEDEEVFFFTRREDAYARRTTLRLARSSTDVSRHGGNTLVKRGLSFVHENPTGNISPPARTPAQNTPLLSLSLSRPGFTPLSI